MEIRVDHVSLGFGQFQVLKDISFSLNENSRLGIVGINGAGKSTLLKIITGELQPDNGDVFISQGTTVGMLRQNAGLNVEKTVYAEMRTAFADLLSAKEEMDMIAKQLEFESSETLLARYNELNAMFEAGEGYQIDTKIKTVLYGMGFFDSDFDKEIAVLSGGEKTRLALAKLLLFNPQVLLLDEPTNHLDLKTLAWLEEYLKNYRGCIVAVSHDRYFLDSVVNQIYALRDCKGKMYSGGYTKYRQLLEQELLTQRREYERQQEEIEKLEDYIARNKVRASTAKMAHSRERMLERIEVMERPTEERQEIYFRFPYDRDPYEVVLDVEGLQVAVEGKNLIDDVNLTVRRGEKCCIVGQNGAGKSTFLKMVLGKNKIKKGRLKIGGMTKISYYEQEGNPFSKDETVLLAIHNKYPHFTELQVRNHLASFEFVGDDIYKKVSELSGGELAKLKFANITLERPNVLVLDEPTNHLDLNAKEKLQQALKEYTGTVIMVSHDRDLLNDIADYIVEMSDHAARRFEGNFESYKEKTKRDAEAAAELVREQNRESKAPTAYGKEARKAAAARRQKLGSLERQIEQLEEEAMELQAVLESEEAQSDYALLVQTTNRLEEIKQLEDMLMEQWAALEE
ncbi:MAG: ABC-F family ATP-binding cassette domain-containing protein [Oscillospiraceae bacterium]|nr:ABC-F family ATP-binding cassette domain-containing protein [Oscillospiraceae bacterium]